MQVETRLWNIDHGVGIKICGVRCLDTAYELTDMGIHAIGLHLFRGRLSGSTVDATAEIFNSLPSVITKVLLTNLDEPGQIATLLERTGADTLQLQSFPGKDALTLLRQRLPRLKVIKTVGSDMSNSFRKIVSEYHDVSDAFLIDKSTAGGTGSSYDWSISHDVKGLTDLPVMIAGGLSSANVVSVIHQCSPYAVDVESSVEGQFPTSLDEIERFGRIKRKWTSIRKVIDFQRAVESTFTETD